MAIEKKPRTLTCVATGKTFVYSGKGRPPKYHPDAVKQARAAQRKKRAA